jgi:hypothetical protein
MSKGIAITERDLREQIRDLCKIFGWKFYFTWTSIHSPRGMPDLILCKTLLDGNTIGLAAELKTEKGKLTDYQREWLILLSKIEGCFSFVWTPSQFDNIVELLQANGLPDIIKLWKKHALFAEKRFGLNLVMYQKE